MNSIRHTTRILAPGDALNAEPTLVWCERTAATVADALGAGRYGLRKGIGARQDIFQFADRLGMLPDIEIDLRMKVSVLNLEPGQLPPLLAKALSPDLLTRANVHTDRNEALRTATGMDAEGALGDGPRPWFWGARVFAPTPWSPTMFTAGPGHGSIIAIPPQPVASDMFSVCEMLIVKGGHAREHGHDAGVWCLRPVVYGFDSLALEVVDEWLHAPRDTAGHGTCALKRAERILETAENGLKTRIGKMSPALPTVVHSLIYGMSRAGDGSDRIMDMETRDAIRSQAVTLLPRLEQGAGFI